MGIYFPGISTGAISNIMRNRIFMYLVFTEGVNAHELETNLFAVDRKRNVS